MRRDRDPSSPTARNRSSSLSEVRNGILENGETFPELWLCFTTRPERMVRCKEVAFRVRH